MIKGNRYGRKFTVELIGNSNMTWRVRAWDKAGNEYTSFTDDNKTKQEAIDDALFGLREVAAESKLMEGEQ